MERWSDGASGVVECWSGGGVEGWSKRRNWPQKNAKIAEETTYLLCHVRSAAANHLRGPAAVGQMSNGWTEMLVMSGVQVCERR
jgi:hypothetical protein